VAGAGRKGGGGSEGLGMGVQGKGWGGGGSVLADGEFGMSRETGLGVFRALRSGRAKGWGYGRALGEAIAKSRLPYRDQSLFAAAARARVPLTVHVAIGTDTLAQHPGMDGALLGEISPRAFP